jgi:hypothetical protein
MKTLLASGAVALGALAFAPEARADSSAWMFIGGGTMAWKQANLKLLPEGSLAFDIGIGTTPNAPLIVGGLFRLQPIFNNQGGGADLSFMMRVASHGFQAGDFGVALDAGFYGRPWWTTSVGLTGEVTLGAPFGLQLSVGGQYGTDQAIGITAVAGIDLLRLTIYRQVALDNWSNPSPAYTKQSKLGAIFF